MKKDFPFTYSTEYVGRGAVVCVVLSLYGIWSLLWSRMLRFYLSRVYLIQPQLVRTVIRISLSLQITGEENKQTWIMCELWLPAGAGIVFLCPGCQCHQCGLKKSPGITPGSDQLVTSICRPPCWHQTPCAARDSSPRRWIMRWAWISAWRKYGLEFVDIFLLRFW